MRVPLHDIAVLVFELKLGLTIESSDAIDSFVASPEDPPLHAVINKSVKKTVIDELQRRFILPAKKVANETPFLP